MSDPSATPIASLEARIAALEEAVAARDAFLAVAAHELRNPMTPILGQVQRLRRRSGDLSPAAIDNSLGLIEALVEGYVRRATTLLDVSRLTQGQFRLDPAPLDIAPVVTAAAAALKPAAHHAGSTLAVHGPTSLNAMVDRVALEQVLDNLLSNAIKYGEGQPITVDLHRDDAAIRIAVSDKGVGISPDDQARIFDRFERAVGKGSGIGGFGVGLWVTSQLAQAMGGSLAVASRPGAGSTFTVALPVAPDAPLGDEGR